MGTMRYVMMTALVVALFSFDASADDSCNQPANEPAVLLPLPGNPFGVVPSPDGCWIFVSLTRGTGGGIAVVGRKNGVASVTRVVETGGNPEGAVLTHDGQMLIVAANDRVFFLDTQRMIDGKRGAMLGALKSLPSPGPRIGSGYVSVTTDGRFLFVSDEYAQRITVVDLQKARASKFKQSAIIGTVRVGDLPIAVTLSPDDRYLYTTSESAAGNWGWPAECKPEGTRAPANAPLHPQGAIVVIDVARAETDPSAAVVARVPAGCSTVRLVLSPKGDIAYVSARNANSLLAFDTAKLIADPQHALIGGVPVGVAPVGVAVVDGGSKVLTANSNRFAGGPDDHSTLTVIDATKIALDAGAVLGTIGAGAFPREMRVTADGKTLLVTNFASKSLEIIDLSRMPVQSSATNR
jgi:DNA-binding beta-propeller fold protein YncE